MFDHMYWLVFKRDVTHLSRSPPPSTPARRWPSTAVSMTTTWSWPRSRAARRPSWPLTPSTPRMRGPARGPASAGSGLCARTWTCSSATVTSSTRTRASPSRCPTCSSTPSTGACTPEPAREHAGGLSHCSRNSLFRTDSLCIYFIKLYTWLLSYTLSSYSEGVSWFPTWGEPNSYLCSLMYVHL